MGSIPLSHYLFRSSRFLLPPASDLAENHPLVFVLPLCTINTDSPRYISPQLICTGHLVPRTDKMAHLFISDEEFSRHSNDAAFLAEKADVFIQGLRSELETVRAEADAASITAEQTCSLLDQKFLSLSAEFSDLQSQNAQLQTTLELRLSELAEVKSQKHQLNLLSVRILFFPLSLHSFTHM